MFWILLALLILTPQSVIGENKQKNIKLTTKNNLILKGPVDEKSVSRIIYELNMLDDRKNIYLYLDTPGGEVESGQRLISEVINHNISCIAERAYSMGFAILQSCYKRYILRHGKLMMHQVSFGVHNDLGRIENYVNFVQQMDFEMNEMMASRIKMHPHVFRERVKDEWWLHGLFATKANCADEIVTVSCSRELTRTNYTQTKGSYDMIYSKCPLVLKEVDKKKNKNKDDTYFFEFLTTDMYEKYDTRFNKLMMQN